MWVRWHFWIILWRRAWGYKLPIFVIVTGKIPPKSTWIYFIIICTYLFHLLLHNNASHFLSKMHWSNFNHNTVKQPWRPGAFLGYQWKQHQHWLFYQHFIEITRMVLFHKVYISLFHFLYIHYSLNSCLSIVFVWKLSISWRPEGDRFIMVTSCKLTEMFTYPTSF